MAAADAADYLVHQINNARARCFAMWRNRRRAPAAACRRESTGFSQRLLPRNRTTEETFSVSGRCLLRRRRRRRRALATCSPPALTTTGAGLLLRASCASAQSQAAARKLRQRWRSLTLGGESFPRVSRKVIPNARNLPPTAIAPNLRRRRRQVALVARLVARSSGGCCCCCCSSC